MMRPCASTDWKTTTLVCGSIISRPVAAAALSGLRWSLRAAGMLAAALSACEAGRSVGTTGVLATAGGCARKSTAGLGTAPIFTVAPYGHRRSPPRENAVSAPDPWRAAASSILADGFTPIGLRLRERV